MYRVPHQVSEFFCWLPKFTHKFNVTTKCYQQNAVTDLMVHPVIPFVRRKIDPIQCAILNYYYTLYRVPLIFDFWTFWQVFFQLPTPHLVNKNVLRKLIARTLYNESRHWRGKLISNTQNLSLQTSNGFGLEKVILGALIVCHFGPKENIFGKWIW